MMNTFSWIFVGLLALMTVIEIYLSLRQSKHVKAHRGEVPDVFKAEITLDAHQKSADYTMAKGRVNRLENLYSMLILLLWTLGGGLAWLSHGVGLNDSALTGVGFLMAFVAVGSVLDLPFSYYRAFVLEQQFGFNRQTPALFFVDWLKQLALGLVMSGLLVWAALFIMKNAGEFWWLYLWAAWMAFSIIMMWAYPAFIAPLFNKFTPLDDEQLKQKVEALLVRCGFKSQGILVMDGSRRSGHGNAYFTGLGSNKRIVFFDTLLETLDEDQVEAVLAHELGHFSRKHVLKNMGLMFILSLVGLALLGWLVTQPWFYNGLGVSEQSNAMALVLFMMVVPVFTFFLQPMMAIMSRKYEYEADEYAAEKTNSAHLITALVELYKENASNLTPDPLVSAIYDSHPPATLRIAHLQSLSK